MLVLALALLAALALLMLLFARHDAPPLALASPPEIPALPERGPNAVKLSYVELAASPQRSELSGATQVYGWLVRADDGRPVAGGMIRLRFQNYAASPGSAAEEHAQELASELNPTGSFRDIRVQEDGGWYVDLPGKCWIWNAEFTPQQEVEGTIRDYLADGNDMRSGVSVFGRSTGTLERKTLIRTTLEIDAPLESGALELSFAVSPGLRAMGLVFDAQSAEPIAGAVVELESLSSSPLASPTGPDGSFEIDGIDPSDLVPANGLITFSVEAPSYQAATRVIAWEPGQPGLQAFKVLLRRESP
jgi:hypothetical protein